MTNKVDSDPAASTIAKLEQIPAEERTIHKDFVCRHIDFLIETLAGEHLQKQTINPAGCPDSLAEKLTRKGLSEGTISCCYSSVSDPRQTESETGCTCGDPLAERSNDPLDVVAAVVLGPDDRSPGERYFDITWRRLIADLKQQYRDWSKIAQLSESKLHQTLSELTNYRGVRKFRIKRLKKLLENVDEHRWTDEISLLDLPSVAYETLSEFLAEQPGVSESDAWWLLLTAFDKPVWPYDRKIDLLLVDLGVLPPDRYMKEVQHRGHVEETLIDHQIPRLHRALAGHAIKSVPHYCSDDCEIRKFLLTYRAKKQANRSKGPVVVDLFSGAGGLSSGFTRSEHDYHIALAVDYDQYATDTYRLNHPELPHRQVVCDDIGEVLDRGDVLETIPDQIDVVVGGPPCQALSQAGYRARLASDNDYSVLDDPRTVLYKKYVEFVEKLSPDAIVMENVEGMINEVGDSEVKVIDQITDALSDAGYTCDSRLIDASEYGIPQKRNRVIVLGMKNSSTSITGAESLFAELEEEFAGESFDLRQGLAGLPRLLRGEGGNVIAARRSGRLGDYVSDNNLAADTSLTFNHQAREHPKPKDRELFDEVMEPGDTGWSVKFEKDRKDLIDYDVGTESNPRFKDKYRMLSWNDPAPTVVAHLAKDANNFIIPDYYEHAVPDEKKKDRRRNRGVTPREAARLQSFPDDYIFLGPFTDQFRQIGNAVPPLLGERIANVLGLLLVRSHEHGKAVESSPDQIWISTND